MKILHRTNSEYSKKMQIINKMLNNVNICVANHVNMFICFINYGEKNYE